jgi:glycosyltransferase involved in cell wall biosynthesis
MKTYCLIPCYNAAPYLRQCLQSSTEFNRVILCDDGSTDDSIKIAQSFSHVEVYERQHYGEQATREYLHSLAADADAIAYLDADDYRIANTLAEQIHLLKTSKADVVFSPIQTSIKTLQPNADIIAALLGHNLHTNGLLIRQNAIARLQQQLGYVRRPGAIVRKEYWFVLDLLRTGAAFIPGISPVAFHRLGIGQSSTVDRRAQQQTYLQQVREIGAIADLNMPYYQALINKTLGLF